LFSPRYSISKTYYTAGLKFAFRTQKNLRGSSEGSDFEMSKWNISFAIMIYLILHPLLVSSCRQCIHCLYRCRQTESLSMILFYSSIRRRGRVPITI
jgi:hypothetical protein